MCDVELPRRLLALGEQPLGERVNIYQKFEIIKWLSEALEEEEMEYIRNSSIGPLLDLPLMPAWSGSFGLFMLARQLETKKDNELWILFAGKPVRFSLREFKIVTRLRCGRYPKETKKKKKGTAGVKSPFYGQLFGLEEDVTIERVVTILKRKSVVDTQMRLRYACLVLVDGILLPTTHYPKTKVSKDHAELVENLDEFLNYPWGRISFQKMMSSIKDRDITSIMTKDVAVQGLVYALQLVMLKAVPAIQESIPTDSDSDGSPVQIDRSRLPLNKNRSKELDEAGEVDVESIISPEIEFEPEVEDLSWSDDEEDAGVANMVRLINEGFNFKKEMFVGGFKPSEFAKDKGPQRGRSKGKPPSRCTRKTVDVHTGKPRKGKTILAQSEGEETDTDRSLLSDWLDSKFENMMNLIERNVTANVRKCIEELNQSNNKAIVERVTTWMMRNAVIGNIPVDELPRQTIARNSGLCRETIARNSGLCMANQVDGQDGSNSRNPRSKTTAGNDLTCPIPSGSFKEPRTSNVDRHRLSSSSLVSVEEIVAFYNPGVSPSHEQDNRPDSTGAHTETFPTNMVPPASPLEDAPAAPYAQSDEYGNGVKETGDVVLNVPLPTVDEEMGSEAPVITNNGPAAQTERPLETTSVEDASEVTLRVSKHNRTLSSRLDGRFHCDKRMKSILGHPGNSEGPEIQPGDIERRYTVAMTSLKGTLNLGEGISLSLKDISEIEDRSKPMGSKVKAAGSLSNAI